MQQTKGKRHWWPCTQSLRMATFFPSTFSCSAASSHPSFPFSTCVAGLPLFFLPAHTPQDARKMFWKGGVGRARMHACVCVCVCLDSRIDSYNPCNPASFGFLFLFLFLLLFLFLFWFLFFLFSFRVTTEASENNVDCAGERLFCLFFLSFPLWLFETCAFTLPTLSSPPQCSSPNITPPGLSFSPAHWTAFSPRHRAADAHQSQHPPRRRLLPLLLLLPLPLPPPLLLPPALRAATLRQRRSRPQRRRRQTASTASNTWCVTAACERRARICSMHARLSARVRVCVLVATSIP